MELKVWVEGIQRIVCGVTETTTCQDVVFALAHATGKIGRFTLIERWRNNERLMAPNENPLKILTKWGEYSNDVQFILQRSDQDKTQSTIANQLKCDSKSMSDSPKKSRASATEQSTKHSDKSSPVLQSNKNSIVNQKPDPRKNDLVGIVKCMPQTTNFNNLSKPVSPPASPSSSTTTDNTDASVSQSLPTPKPSLPMSPILEFNSADVRNSLDRKTSSFRESINLSIESLQDPFKSNNSSHFYQVELNSTDLRSRRSLGEMDISGSEMYINGPPISSNGALIPPPYRNPPPPQTNSPQQLNTSAGHNSGFHHQKSDSQSSSNSTNANSFGKQVSMKYELTKEKSPNNFTDNNANHTTNIHLNAISNLQAIVSDATSDSELLNNNHFTNAQYRDLIQLIKSQREKINVQQSDITKYDAEIIYLENKERDQAQQMDAIARELTKADQMYRQGSEQLQSLQYVEEENELVRQQEKTLKSEITLLRSKLANCETELLQCKNKIRMLMDDIQVEQRVRHFDGHQLEVHLMQEMENIQTEIDQAVHNSESNNKINDSLKKEVSLIEHAIAEKKKQLEKLVNEMKEVNLQSLTATSTEEIRHLLEGSQRPGSTRRIMGSPRQLETAVPTSKNPHGVWV